MANIPESVKNLFLVKWNLNNLIHQGKVRDTYKIENYIDPNTLAVVATDRISIFDFVLDDTIAQKGEVLTALTHYWLTRIIFYSNHLLQADKIHKLGLRYCGYDLKKTLFVRRMKIAPYEMVFRAHLGGSVYGKYLETGIVAGQRLPPGIKKWAKLEEPIFTPTTKAEDGNDKPISVEQFLSFIGQTLGDGRKIIETARRAYANAYKYAENRGILILDTKIEGAIRKGGRFMFCDEIFTPDSSRFTTVKDFAASIKEGRDPIFYDKEVVREWGRKIETPFTDKNSMRIVGINNLDPENDDHTKFVHSLKIPLEIKEEARRRYLAILKMITGEELSNYQKYYLL